MPKHFKEETALAFAWTVHFIEDRDSWRPGQVTGLQRKNSIATIASKAPEATMLRLQ